jgi:hypothetical protein
MEFQRVDGSGCGERGTGGARGLGFCGSGSAAGSEQAGLDEGTDFDGSGSDVEVPGLAHEIEFIREVSQDFNFGIGFHVIV